jgi:hypothetical protein
MILDVIQAFQIKKDFTYLVGKPFFPDGVGALVEDIVVAPYDFENRDIFLDRYDQFDSNEDALEDYPISFYTVLLLTTIRGEAFHEEIFHYTGRHGIIMDLKNYNIKPSQSP